MVITVSWFYLEILGGFILIGIFLYMKLENKPVLRVALLWLFATSGMIVKHNIFYELIICLNSAIRRYRIKLALFAVSVFIFLALFIPYWSEGSKGIIRNVFIANIPLGIAVVVMIC